MIPMVFWASLVPWLRLNAADETSWSARKYLSTIRGLARRKLQAVAVMSAMPAAMPITGERRMKRTGLTHPPRISALTPALATAAPP